MTEYLFARTTDVPDLAALVAELLFTSLENLTANRTYYVRADGNDNNNGQSDTAGGAFLTQQKAMNTIWGLNLNNHEVTVEVRAGTYEGFYAEGPLLVGTFGRVTVNYAVGTNINTTAVPGITLSGGAVLRITGSPTFADAGVEGFPHLYIHGEDNGIGSYLYMDATATFGRCSTTDGTFKIASGGEATIRSSYTISDDQHEHWDINMLGRMVVRGPITITLTGTPAFTNAFANIRYGGGCRCADITFAGSATGKRFHVEDNGWIATNNAGLSYFPGDVAGTLAHGGVYDGYHSAFTTLPGSILNFDLEAHMGPLDGATGFGIGEVRGTTGAELHISRYANAVSDPDLIFNKSRGTTVGAQGLVQVEDAAGQIWWRVSDGVGLRDLASIKANVDDTPGEGDTPGRLVFFTTPKGTATLIERLRITNAGHHIYWSATTTPPTLASNGQWVMTPTSNTNMRISYRGSDGTTRVANITLS